MPISRNGKSYADLGQNNPGDQYSLREPNRWQRLGYRLGFLDEDPSQTYQKTFNERADARLRQLQIDHMLNGTPRPTATPSTPAPTPTATIPPPPPIRPSAAPTPQNGASPGFAGDPIYSAFLKQSYNNQAQRTPVQVPSELTGPIDKYSREYSIPPDLLRAIAYHESLGFTKQHEIGGGLGRGYFQIDLGQHPDVTEQQALNPDFATKYAAQLLRNNLQQYQDARQAIRAYNGNPYDVPSGTTSRARKQSAKAQEATRQYLKQIVNTLNQYSFQ